MGRKGGNTVQLNKRKKHVNMASGPGWRSKLWISVNGEVLIEIEALPRPFEHGVAQKFNNKFGHVSSARDMNIM